eukprot:2829758-Rhodomonas_salina.1
MAQQSNTSSCVCFRSSFSKHTSVLTLTRSNMFIKERERERKEGRCPALPSPQCGCCTPRCPSAWLVEAQRPWPWRQWKQVGESS